MMLGRLRSFIFSGELLVALVLLGIAAWAYRAGAEDQRYQLAGTADPFLGHPAPVVSVIAGIVLSATVMVLAISTARSPTLSPPASLLRPRCASSCSPSTIAL